MSREYAALIVGKKDCFVGTVFQSEDGKVESIGTTHMLDLPLELRETRHFQKITEKNPNGNIRGKQVWILSHYESSALTAMIRGIHDKRGRNK